MIRTLAASLPRVERVQQILALRARGLTNPEIAAELGIAASTVRNSLCDPDGNKQRERRRTYEGQCVDCGATTKSDGTSKASDRCVTCSVREFHPKVWTRETVIDAIQRFAKHNGRAPTADEWITADTLNGYPPRSSVYRSTNPRSVAPFQSWQEALAAAGFPGAYSGRRTYKEVHPMETDRKGYVILRETETGWEIVGESEEQNQIAALNASLNGHAPEGKWVAIPGRYWRPREIRPRTIFDWAEDTEPTTAA